MSRIESDVAFVCQDCGCPFAAKARFARMIRSGEQEERCRRCQNDQRRRHKTAPVTDTDRRFWLTRFDDFTLASIASTLFDDVPFNPALFTAAREIVMGEPEVMVASAVPPDRKVA